MTRLLSISFLFLATLASAQIAGNGAIAGQGGISAVAAVQSSWRQS